MTGLVMASLRTLSLSLSLYLLSVVFRPLLPASRLSCPCSPACCDVEFWGGSSSFRLCTRMLRAFVFVYIDEWNERRTVDGWSRYGIPKNCLCLSVSYASPRWWWGYGWGRWCTRVYPFVQGRSLRIRPRHTDSHSSEDEGAALHTKCVCAMLSLFSELVLPLLYSCAFVLRLAIPAFE